MRIDNAMHCHKICSHRAPSSLGDKPLHIMHPVLAKCPVSWAGIPPCTPISVLIVTLLDHQDRLPDTGSGF